MTLFTVSSLGFRTSPLSPLFPYTTLFRSSYALARLATKGSCLLRSTRETLRSGSQSLNPQLQLHYRLWPCFHSHQTRQNWSQDRKSTRLNSSHRCISYAVFCLKKKKMNNN